MSTRDIGGREFDFEREVAVVAVVNRTPDSFYDRGATFALDHAVSSALRAEELGASWVDVGGVPFGRGPGVTTDEEIDRVVPLVSAIASARNNIVISVDTNKAAVARAALIAGASVINDTSGLGDPEMADVIAQSGAHVVITHSVGPPRAEKPPASYSDVIRDVRAFLVEKIRVAEVAGIARDHIIIDPGHDLDKNTLHTLEITRRLDEIADIGLPMLVAVSNKDFIGESIDRPQRQRLSGSLAAMTVCILHGARLVRMHDVAEAVDAARMAEAILGMRRPAYLEHNTHATHNI